LDLELKYCPPYEISLEILPLSLFILKGNVFIPVVPIRHDLHKKLHKVLHLFLLHTFGA